MKILVTGAAGFIGFYVAEMLAKKGFAVVGIDNINNYYDTRLKFARLEESGIKESEINDNLRVQSSKYENYCFYKQDITDYDRLFQLFAQEKIDFVVHLAAQAGVRYSLENPHAYVQSNIVGFLNILECCKIGKVRHLVYASSSSVYGNSDKVPFSETDNVDHPVSLYAATKKSNELMAHTYSHLYQLPTTGLRFFTVYGPWGRPDMSPVIFAKAIMAGQPIKIFNQGNMQRDFTYINDITEGIFKVMFRYPNRDAYQPYYALYNIGNSTPVHLMDFIQTMETALKKEAIKEYLPMQPGDVYQTYADTTFLQKDVEYNPSTPLSEGMAKFINWYKQQKII